MLKQWFAQRKVSFLQLHHTHTIFASCYVCYDAVLDDDVDDDVDDDEDDDDLGDDDGDDNDLGDNDNHHHNQYY